MQILFSPPLDQAHVEVLFTFPIINLETPSATLTVTGVGASQVFTTLLFNFSDINGAPHTCGRVVLIAPSPAVKLNTLLDSDVVVTIDYVTPDESGFIQAIAQSSKREVTTLTVEVGQDAGQP